MWTCCSFCDIRRFPWFVFGNDIYLLKVQSLDLDLASLSETAGKLALASQRTNDSESHAGISFV